MGLSLLLLNRVESALRVGEPATARTLADRLGCDVARLAPVLENFAEAGYLNRRSWPGKVPAYFRFKEPVDAAPGVPRPHLPLPGQMTLPIFDDSV